MRRADAIRTVLRLASPEDLVLCTTGMISREAFSFCDRTANFYMIGSLGLISSLALGIAMLRPQQRVIVLEGDGSLLLNLGSLAMIARERPKNFQLIVLDNECYESTGGQPSISKEIDLTGLARAAGFAHVHTVSEEEDLEPYVIGLRGVEGPNFLLVKVDARGTPGIARVVIEPAALAERFRSAILQPPLAKDMALHVS